MPKISASSQDYLETILELSLENPLIRSVDVAARMGVSRASVNRAMGVLKNAGFVTQERYSDIYLTELGREAARSVLERHQALKRFLTDILHVSEETAELDACKMEHNVSEETLEKLKQFMDQQ